MDTHAFDLGNLGPAGGPKENMIYGGVKLHINNFTFEPSGAEHCATDAATDCYELLRIAMDTHNKSTLV